MPRLSGRAVQRMWNDMLILLSVHVVQGADVSLHLGLGLQHGILGLEHGVMCLSEV